MGPKIIYGDGFIYVDRIEAILANIDVIRKIILPRTKKPKKGGG